MRALPQEIEAKFLIPALRKGLCLELYKMNMSQKEISRSLGITQGAVSHYLSDKRGKEVEFLKNTLSRHIKLGAKKIKEGHNPSDIIFELCKKALDLGITCDLHKKYDTIPENCDLCFRRSK